MSRFLPRVCLGLLLAVVSGLALAAGSAPAPAPPAEPGFETVILSIESGTGRHVFTVEVAATQAQRARGLMYRRELAPEAGMLFVFEVEQGVRMWMKDTYIPLDMLFIAGDGRIVRIAERTEPFSTRLISSVKPVRAVLELPAGTAARLGLRRGDRVRHPVFTVPSDG